MLASTYRPSAYTPILAQVEWGIEKNARFYFFSKKEKNNGYSTITLENMDLTEEISITSERKKKNKQKKSHTSEDKQKDELCSSSDSSSHVNATTEDKGNKSSSGKKKKKKVKKGKKKKSPMRKKVISHLSQPSNVIINRSEKAEELNTKKKLKYGQ